MQPTRGAPLRGLLLHAGVAAAVYALDAFVLAQGAVAAITTVILVLFGLSHVVRGLASRGKGIVYGLAMMAIYLGMMASVVATISANNQLASRRADEIVAALKQYRATTGDYPAHLTDLVPGYLPSIPRAKYTLMFDDFSYHHTPNEPGGFLMYTTLPPFGRRTYSLDTTTWGSLD